MKIQVPPIRPSSFDELVHRSRFALIRLDASPRVEFHRGVAEFFASAHPGQFRFGALSRTAIREKSWLEASFKSTVGTLRAGVGDGYYLFQSGLVAGHHGGAVRGHSAYASSDIEAQRKRVIRYGFSGVGAQAEVVESARQIIVYFDDIVSRRMGVSDSDRYVDGDTGPNPGSQRSAPPPRPAQKPTGPSPYEVLGVSKAATDADVKMAYKSHVKMNHPDKVSHLSPALQKFAEAQVLEILAAYKAIMAERG